LIAAFIRRNVESRAASFARIASFMAACSRSRIVIGFHPMAVRNPDHTRSGTGLQQALLAQGIVL
jgi:hypothetical protein